MEYLRYPAGQRRLRTDEHMRELTASVQLSHRGFIQPLFVEQGLAAPFFLHSMSDVPVDTEDSVLHTIESDIQQGIRKFLLFPVPSQKTEESFDFEFAARLVKSIKEHFGPEIWLASDLCLCSYTSHGHCGILSADGTRVLNNASVEQLTRYAGILGAAGIDCIAPSDMMDGRIAAIRTVLDGLGYDQVSIMSYAAKFSSQWYGPFRDACHSAPNVSTLMNRKSYQLSPFNPGDAINTALRDEKEGADILMIKPAGLYTDIISKIREKTYKPLAAYHVSGEYAAIELMAAAGHLQREQAHLETWAAVKRSGADIIISYAARYARQWISEANY